MPGQRQRRGAVAGQRYPATGHARGKCLGRIGEHLAAGTVAQRLGIQLVGQRCQVDAQPGVHGLQSGQARGQIPAQPELVGDPQPRRQHRDATRRGVPQRTLIRCHHDNPRTPAHPGRGRPDQRGITGIVTGDDQHIERADPRRRLAGDRDRLGSRSTQRRGQHGPGSIRSTPAGHPNHRARTIAAAQ